MTCPEIKCHTLHLKLSVLSVRISFIVLDMQLFCDNVELLILPEDLSQKVTITAKRNYDKTVLDERTDEYTD